MSQYKLHSMTISIYIFTTQVFCADSVSFKGIMNQIYNKEFKPYQTIALHDGQNESLEVKNEILREIFNKCPSRVINFVREDPRKHRLSIASKSYHERTLLVAIMNDSTDPKEALKFLMNISKKYSHPRCLMIILLDRKNSNRENVLRFGWSNNFLNLTILDVEKKAKVGNFFNGQRQGRKVIHYFNPFSEIYTRRRYTKGLVIFPKKLKDDVSLMPKILSLNVVVLLIILGFSILTVRVLKSF